MELFRSSAPKYVCVLFHHTADFINLNTLYANGAALFSAIRSGEHEWFGTTGG